MEPSRHANVWAALLAVQADVEGLHKSAANPHFKSRYTPLPEVLAVVRPILTTHGLVLSQSVESMSAEWVSVVTTLYHVGSGTSVERGVPMPLTSSKGPVTCQSVGSAVTYGRRYGLVALLGVGEDDDANLASGNGRVASASPQPGAAAKPIDKVPIALRVKKARSYFAERGLGDAALEEYLGGVPVDQWGVAELTRLTNEKQDIFAAFPHPDEVTT